MLAFILVVFFLLIITVLSFYIYVKTNTGVCVSSRHLVGKVVLVTGGTSGIGYETAADLAERGARVLIASNERHGDSVRDTIVVRSGNTDVHFIYLDLASLDSVRSVATDIIAKEKRLDVLINNAGMIDVKNEKSEDGFPIVMQVNYFGPFLLTNLLLPLISSTPRSKIVNVASVTYKYGRVDLDNLNTVRSGYLSSYLTYFDSKLCVALMTVELARRYQGTGVTANFLHPGFVLTKMINTRIFRIILPICKPFVKTPRQAAQTAIYLAVSPEVEVITGCYFEDCKVKKIFIKARDKDLASALWIATEEILTKSPNALTTTSSSIS